MIDRIIIVIVSAILLCSLAPRALLADEPPCIRTRIHGIDSAMTSAVRTHLADELGVPVDAPQRTDESCVTIFIHIENQQAKIRLSDDTGLEITLRLEDVRLRYWPRAVALSAAGLLVRQTEADANPHTTPPEVAPPTPKSEAPSEKEKTAAQKGPPSAPEDKRPSPSRPGLFIGLRFGARLMPVFPAWLGEVAAGAHLVLGSVEIGISALSIYGRRTLRLGRMYATGGGIEASLGWRVLGYGRFHLFIEPAVDAFAVYSYARGSVSSAETDALWAPAVTLHLSVAGAVDLGSRLRLRIAAGGGYNAVYVRLRMKDQDTYGLSGGYVIFNIGLDFKLSQ